MPRSWSFALVCAVLASPALRAGAAAQPSPTALAPQHSVYGERGDTAAMHARDAGSIDGQVVGVDYKSGALSVATGRGKVEVFVLPSTSIQAEKSGFHTIADIVKGAKVHVLMSRRGDHLIAQIINLKN